MNSSVSKFGIALLSLLLSMGALHTAFAQDANTQSGEQNELVAEETLSATTVTGDTTGASMATFGRLSLAAHATARFAALAEQSIYFLEQGTWVVHQPSVTGTITPAGSVLVNGTPLVPGTTVSLEPGGWLSLPPRSTVEVSNTNAVPSEALAMVLSDRSTSPVGSGVTWQPLGDAVEVPAGEKSVAFSRLTLDPGASMTPQVTSGPTVFDTRSGSVILLLNPGVVQVSRAGGGNENVTAGYIDPSTLYPDDDDLPPTADDAIAEPPSTPLPGTAVGLGAGDGALLKTGATQALRVTGNTTAVVLVLTISPADSQS